MTNFFLAVELACKIPALITPATLLKLQFAAPPVLIQLFEVSSEVSPKWLKSLLTPSPVLTH